MKVFKKIKYLLTSLIIIITSIFLTSCDDCVIEQSKENFKPFTESIFRTLIGEDEFTSNFLFNNPEDYGLERYEPSLPLPGKSEALGLIIINLYLGQIKGFNYEELNTDEQITYDIIVDLLDNINAQTPEMSYLSNDYLGSYLGYQAQLPLLLTEYKFKDVIDVDNYFKYLDLVPETFKKYVLFEEEKADNGYGMPDFVIDKVVAQCESFISGMASDEHFMISSINKKIDNLEFLTLSEKENYKKLNIEKVRGPLTEGYEYVKTNLPLLKGRATNNMGLAHYVSNDGTEIGKNYYEIAFKKAVGYDISVVDAISYIDAKLAKYEDERSYFSNLVKDNPNLLYEIQNVKFMDNTPENQLQLYQTIINGHFPTLELEQNLNVNVNYIDKAMEDHFSPAAYMTSALDEYVNENIYLNNKSIMIETKDEDGNLILDELGNPILDYDYNYLFTTLAHEGFPGHLYQNVYFKNQDVNIIRKVLKNQGYLEGWATYAERYMYKLLDGYNKDVIDYYLYQEEFQSAIYSRLDMGIHYNGWTLEETHAFLSKYYNLTIEQTQATYERLIEVPNNSQYYYFTYFKLVDLYDKVSSAMGDNFDVTDFHKQILDCGPIPLKYVEKRVLEHYGIE